MIIQARAAAVYPGVIQKLLDPVVWRGFKHGHQLKATFKWKQEIDV